MRHLKTLTGISHWSVVLFRTSASQSLIISWVKAFLKCEAIVFTVLKLKRPSALIISSCSSKHLTKQSSPLNLKFGLLMTFSCSARSFTPTLSKQAIIGPVNGMVAAETCWNWTVKMSGAKHFCKLLTDLLYRWSNYESKDELNKRTHFYEKNLIPCMAKLDSSFYILELNYHWKFHLHSSNYQFNCDDCNEFVSSFICLNKNWGIHVDLLSNWKTSIFTLYFVSVLLHY